VCSSAAQIGLAVISALPLADFDLVGISAIVAHVFRVALILPIANVDDDILLVIAIAGAATVVLRVVGAGVAISSVASIVVRIAISTVAAVVDRRISHHHIRAATLATAATVATDHVVIAAVSVSRISSQSLVSWEYQCSCGLDTK